MSVSLASINQPPDSYRENVSHHPGLITVAVSDPPPDVYMIPLCHSGTSLMNNTVMIITTMPTAADPVYGMSP